MFEIIIKKCCLLNMRIEFFSNINKYSFYSLKMVFENFSIFLNEIKNYYFSVRLKTQCFYNIFLVVREFA